MTETSGTCLEKPVTRVTPTKSKGLLAGGAVLAVLLLSLVQFFFFKRYFDKFVAPFHLVNSDQLMTYLWTYRAYFATYLTPQLLCDDQLCSQKGALLPFLTLASTHLFGPQRFSIAVVNFLMLVIGEFSIVWILAKNYGRSTASLALSLFLCSGTHFFQFGGLDDMRRDYCGMIVSGIVFLSSWRWLVIGSKTSYVAAFASICTLALARFVSIFYWAIGLPLAVVVAFALKHFPATAGLLSQELPGRLLKLWIGCLVVCCLHLLAFWPSFSNYYVKVKFTNEDPIRWVEFNVHSLADRLLYYPQSLWIHVHVIIISGLAFFAIIKLIDWCKQKEFANEDRAVLAARGRESNVAYLLLACMLFAAYCVLTYYSPSPTVIGAFSMPFAVSLALLCSPSLNALPLRQSVTVSAISLMAATFFFLYQFKHPTFLPHPYPHSAVEISKLLDSAITIVKARQPKKTVVYWMDVHEGLQSPAFLIRWYETQKTPAPDELQHRHVVPFPPQKLEQMLADLASADVVVAPIDLPLPPSGWFEYPGITQLRRNLPELKKVLARDFHLEARYEGVWAGNPNPWTLGLYKR